MKTVEYTPNGRAFSDSSSEEEARNFLRSNKTCIEASTENFITAIRVLVHERRYSHTEVEFLFDGKKMPPDKNGRLREWPYGFCDVNERFLIRLLDQAPSSDLPL